MSNKSKAYDLLTDEERDKKIGVLKDAGMSTRLVGALARHGKKTGLDYLDPEFLRQLPDEELLRVRGVWFSSVGKIRSVLEAMGSEEK